MFTIDGSRVSLPRELINEGFIVCSADQGNYYPPGLMSCLYNIQEKVVYDFSLQAHLNERLSALEHIQQLGSKDIVVLDRGYFSYLMLYKIIEQNCHVIFRIPFGIRNNTNNEIMNFIETDQEDSTIDYMPSTTVMHDLKKDGYNLKFRPLKVRLIKHKINDTTYIYATTLTDKYIFPKECFYEIYHSRWSIKELYKISKRFIEIEDFHAKSARGIKQELYALYAHILLINLSRFFEFEAEKLIPSNKSEDNKYITNTFDPISMIKINFKNCLLIVTRQLENLVMTGCILTNNTLQKIISSIAKVRQKVRLNRHYPKISRKSINRWVTSHSRRKFA
ncbi:transposase [Candidatus Rickettsia colombianensi]|uniref:transposase n=1 Tax=Candidatus Rickettsia colombianensi TaxID=1090944 RepID=UPI000EF256DF|nr:transposase [Candidatus Rickettsia colombianensi]